MDGACPIITQPETSCFTTGGPVLYYFFRFRIEEYYLLGTGWLRFVK